MDFLARYTIARGVLNEQVFFATRCFIWDDRFYFYGLLSYNFLSNVSKHIAGLPNTGTVCSLENVYQSSHGTTLTKAPVWIDFVVDCGFSTA